MQAIPCLDGWTFYDLPAGPDTPSVYLMPPGRGEPLKLPLAGILPEHRRWFSFAVRSQLVPGDLVAALLGAL